MSKTNFQTLPVYRLAEQLADAIWDIVQDWQPLAKDTIGKPIILAADGIGATIAKGVGLGDVQDNQHCVKMAISSLSETQRWLRQADTQQLITEQQINQLNPLISELESQLNLYLKSNVTEISRFGSLQPLIYRRVGIAHQP
ncbi:MAG: four helix bundle protein [Coleofasciculus sp. C1-SOL-03]|jgi:four helix bundle protein|uniref:four helix bundle protein n=1 Tax=Coleofasciculus sp. C1-SOL-03 TaxID=3069522 RepID=UPI0032FFDB48